MTRAEIRIVVIEILDEVVTAVGGDMPSIDDATKPIGALPKFDSVLAEDTTVDVFKRLGLSADLDVNPFIREQRAATLSEVVETLEQCLNGQD